MNELDDDMALKALLTSAREAGLEAYESLVRSAYQVQKAHQFDRDEHREQSMQLIRGLISEQVDAAEGEK